MIRHSGGNVYACTVKIVLIMHDYEYCHCILKIILIYASRECIVLIGEYSKFMHILNKEKNRIFNIYIYQILNISI